MMNRAFTVQVTPEIVRDATRRFIWRHFRWSGVVACILGLIMIGYFTYTNTNGWLGGFLSGVLFLFVAAFIAAYFIRVRQGLRFLERMGDTSVHYVLSEDEFSATSSLGSSTLKWEAVKGIWRLPTCWLLFIEKGAYLTIPLKGPTQQDLDFLSSKVLSKDEEIQ